MALANVNEVALRAERGGEKPFSLTKVAGATPPDPTVQALAYVKWNPDWEEGLTPGVKAEAATVEVDATNIILRVDGALDRNIAHAGLSAREVVEAVEEPQNGARRWRAGIGDRESDSSTVFVAQAELNAMVGQDELGVPLESGLGFFMLVGVGNRFSREGGGNTLPGMFNTPYDYPRGGLVSPTQVGRGGGIAADQGEDVLPQRASKFGTANRTLAREGNSARPKFEVFVRSISHNLVAGAGEDLRVQLFEGDPLVNVPIWQHFIPAGSPEPEILVPNVRCANAAYLQIFGAGFGNIVGQATMRGITRAA